MHRSANRGRPAAGRLLLGHCEVIDRKHDSLTKRPQRPVHKTQLNDFQNINSQMSGPPIISVMFGR